MDGSPTCDEREAALPPHQRRTILADPTYTPPEVWQNDTENGGRFAGINRPTAGAREEK